MSQRPITQEHIHAFRTHLCSIAEELPIDPEVLDTLFQRITTWPPAQKSAMAGVVSADVRTWFTPLQPVVAILSPPNYFSEDEPALALYLMTVQGALEAPFSSVHFADGRRMLEVFRLLLDTGGERSRYDPQGGALVSDGLSQKTRRLIERELRCFPALTKKGEALRARALRELQLNALE